MLRFLFGLSLGAAIGLLVAPARGEVTRQQLENKAEALKRSGIEAGREKAREVGSHAGERLYDKAIGER